jgi:hypothetical protein
MRFIVQRKGVTMWLDKSESDELRPAEEAMQWFGGRYCGDWRVWDSVAQKEVRRLSR